MPKRDDGRGKEGVKRALLEAREPCPAFPQALVALPADERIRHGRSWNGFQADADQQSAENDRRRDEATASDPTAQRLRVKQDTGQIEKPDADPNGHEIREPRRLSNSEGDCYTNRPCEQREQREANMIGLGRDPVKGKHQSRHKGGAIHNGNPPENRSPCHGLVPVRHRAQDTSMTEPTAILRNGGGWRGCWHGLCARRAPTIKRRSLDARSGNHTNNLAEAGEELCPASLNGCSQ